MSPRRVAALFVAGGCFALTACDSAIGGHGSTPRLLSHTAVERFIADKYGVYDVRCNNNRNFPMVSAGDTFTCTDATVNSYTVTIVDPKTGRYRVR